MPQTEVVLACLGQHRACLSHTLAMIEALVDARVDADGWEHPANYCGMSHGASIDEHHVDHRQACSEVSTTTFFLAESEVVEMCVQV
jgi:hypothetical protein